MEQKEKHVTRIAYLRGYVTNLLGLGSGIMPESKLLVCYNDTTNKHMIVKECSSNIAENPLTGMIDVTIKLSLQKEEYTDETHFFRKL